jgi:hypothetical protein
MKQSMRIHPIVALVVAAATTTHMTIAGARGARGKASTDDDLRAAYAIRRRRGWQAARRNDGPGAMARWA